MVAKYVQLQDKVNNWDVFQKKYYKVIKQFGYFEEDEAPSGWYRFVVTNERPQDEDGKFICHHYEFRDDTLYKTYFIVDSLDDSRLYTVKDYEDAIQEFLDKTVQQRGYDNVYTCLSYKDDPDPIFAAEADAVLAWRSQVWRTAQGILNQWATGQIEQPTIQQVISQLPELGW